MNYSKFHFIYEEKKPESVELAEKLISHFGQSALKDCEAVVTIGGDGSLINGFQIAQGKPVYGLTPAISNSNGFWTDHDVDSVESFVEHLGRARVVPLNPIQADIEFDNGNRKTIYAVNEVAIERTSGQAAFFKLSVHFNGVSSPQYEIKGDGMVFSSSFGSTGTSRSYHGPVVEINTPSLTLTPKGVCDPLGGMAHYVASGKDTSFCITFISAASKRPIRIDYDGGSVTTDKDGSSISKMAVSLVKDSERTVNFLTTKNPALKGFESIFPQAPKIVP